VAKNGWDAPASAATNTFAACSSPARSPCCVMRATADTGRGVGSRSDGAQADQGRGRRASQQDRPHRVGGDDAWGRLPSKAGAPAAGIGAASPRKHARDEEEVMASGRAADREGPQNSRRNAARILDWDPIGELHQARRSHAPYRRAGHMTAPDHFAGITLKSLARGGPFSNRASLVNSLLPLCCRNGVTVLFAVGRLRRNIWSEAQALQCPQRARCIVAAQGPPSQPPAPSPRRATVTFGACSG
jgi:hypothetical protein